MEMMHDPQRADQQKKDIPEERGFSTLHFMPIKLADPSESKDGNRKFKDMRRPKAHQNPKGRYEDKACDEHFEAFKLQVITESEKSQNQSPIEGLKPGRYRETPQYSEQAPFD
jgi:hypothetical protein